MGRRKILKWVFVYKPYYLYIVWGITGAFFLFNIVWTCAVIQKPLVLYYDGFLIPKIIIEKQNEIIELQYALILELKAEYGTLKVAYTQEKAEKESLEADIYATLNPWFKAMDAEIHIVNGKLLIEGPNGLRSVH